MHSVKLLSAAAVLGAGLVSAQSTCTKDITITEPTPSIDCSVVDADIKVDDSVEGIISIEGPQQIKGDLIITNATGVRGVSSSSINAIGGRLELKELEFLTNVEMPSLRTINEVVFQRLPRLNSIRFGDSGLTRVSSVLISDTFLNDLSGFNINSVARFSIDNNQRLRKYESSLVNITERFVISNNGEEMEINLDDLELAGDMELSNVKSISLKSLERINGSLTFAGNPELESFKAPNLTEIQNDIRFFNNRQLTNLSFPELTEISGGMTVVNNTKLIEIDGFPKLEVIAGGLNMTGDFEDIQLPSLEDVKGSVYVGSSTDIDDFCKFFNDAKDDGRIQGTAECESNEASAGTDEGGSNGGSSDDDDDSAAGSASANMALLGVAAFIGFAQML